MKKLNNTGKGKYTTHYNSIDLNETQ